MIRTATIQDAKAILDIYAPYIIDTAITFEYDVPSLEEFQDRMKQTLLRYPYLVEEKDGEILGYAYASPLKERKAYDWSVEVTVYVKEDVIGQGTGRKLYEALEEALKKQNIINVNACIAYPEQEDEYLDQTSVEFHKHMGYEMVGKFHNCGYKFGKWYHMVWMEKMLGEHPDKPEKVKSFQEI